MHLLQEFDIPTQKLTKTHSMAQTSIPCSAGELLPAAQREGVISFGPYRWPPSAPTTKSRDAVSCSLCCHLGPRRSPHRFTPIDMTAVLWGGTHQKGVFPPLGRQRRLFSKQLTRLQNSASSGSAASAPLLLTRQVSK